MPLEYSSWRCRRNGFMPAANSVIGQWLGHGYLGVHGSIHPYYIMTALYLIVFSIGEAFYSPRVYEYAAAIAPKGQEASCGSLAYLPFLVGKLLVGAGGWLLAAFCSGTRSAALRNDVAYLCSGGIGRADRVDCAASLHSRPRSRAAGLIGKMADDRRRPSHFLVGLRINLRKSRST